MKKIIASLVLVSAVSVAAFGATRAYFSDIATINGNTFSTGTVDLTLGGTIPLNETGVAPGTKFNDKYVELRNTGNLDMLFKMYVNPIENPSNIAQYVTVKITLNPSDYTYTEGYNPYGPKDYLIATKKLSDLLGSNNALDNVNAAFYSDGKLLPKFAAVYKLEMSLDFDTPNYYQNKTFIGDIVAQGVQFDGQVVNDVKW